MRNQQNVKVRVNSNFETICPFPVGYVYMSSNSTSPADIYGGTWSAISGGRYMRAASAWGNGGSNTITTSQMPSHNHVIPKHYVYDKTGWSAPINGLSLPQVASPIPSTTPFATVASLDAVTNTGGGQHSTPLTKTFGRGTELPKEGDASCVTFNKFKLGPATRLKEFVHFQLATSICQATRQVQRTFMAARGHLSQMVDFGEQAVRGIPQAVLPTALSNCHILELLQKKWGLLQGHIWAWPQTTRLAYPHKDESFWGQGRLVFKGKLQLLVRFRLTAPVTAGIAQPSLAVM